MISRQKRNLNGTESLDSLQVFKKKMWVCGNSADAKWKKATLNSFEDNSKLWSCFLKFNASTNNNVWDHVFSNFQGKLNYLLGL